VSPATLAWSGAWVLAAAVACVRLLRASRQPERSVRDGYRWLAVAAACLAVGGIVQQAFGGLIGGAQPLRMADLLSLAALPALVLGLGAVTSEAGTGEAAGAAGRLLREAGRADRPGSPPGIVLDSCLLACSLFTIGLVTMFGADYAGTQVGRAAFALALVRPAADVAALGMVLRFAVRNVRLTLLPVLALAALAAGDSLAVGDRVAGRTGGGGAQAALLVALVLLALAATPLPARLALTGPRRAGGPGSPDGRAAPDSAWASPATIVALSATAAAAVAAAGYAVAGGLAFTPALGVTGSAVVLLLVARLAGVARQASVVAASAQESDWMFRALADATSDAVMICDLVGTIEYASSGVAEFGYTPAGLIGRPLASLVHPEDRPAGIRAALTGLRGSAGTATFAGRIRGADGSWRHVESTLSRYGEAGAPARLLIATHDVSDRVALRHQVTQLTFHDGLTGLPNRAYLEERVRDLVEQAPPAASAAGAVAAAIRLDLDDFSAVNDLIGSAGGDLLLAQAGRRLRAAVPPPATVARWGSDEFAVLTGGIAPAEAIDMAEQLAGQIAGAPFTVAGKEISMTASVGVATASQRAADQVLGFAGFALSRAKEAPSGRVEVFEARMHAQALRRAELAGGLRHAIAGHQLELDYRPVAELATGRIRQVRASARWPRGDETVDSAELLGVAQDYGLVGALGDWVLAQACRQVASWRAAGQEIGLSVRCELRQVAGPRFVASVLAALDQADLPPQALTIAVAERVLLDSAAPIAAGLAGLRGKGIRLAIDSFGTGYASLGYLRRSAVDAIMIDASLVAGLETDPTLALLTAAIVRLAHDLGIEVVAEGIERPGQRERLEAMGCRLGAGTAVAAPLAGDQSPQAARADAAATGAGTVPAG